MDLLAYVYRAMGLTSSDIDETILQSYLDDWTSIYPDNDCLAMHNTVISMYEYLMRSEAPEASGGGRRREKEGNVEYEIEDYDKSSDWSDALKAYLNSPSSAFPLCKVEFDALKKGGNSRVIVGGVREDKICDINRNPNQRTGGANEICGVTRKRTRGNIRGWFR